MTATPTYEKAADLGDLGGESGEASTGGSDVRESCRTPLDLVVKNYNKRIADMDAQDIPIAEISLQHAVIWGAITFPDELPKMRRIQLDWFTDPRFATIWSAILDCELPSIPLIQSRLYELGKEELISLITYGQELAPLSARENFINVARLEDIHERRKLKLDGLKLIEVANDPATLNKTTIHERLNEIVSSAVNSGSGAWPEIIPLGRSAEEMPFPVDALPPVIRDYVESVAASRQVPVDLPAMLAIGMMAMASAKTHRVQIGSTHDEPLNLFILSLLEPGERKTGTFKDLIFPAEEVERLLIERAAPEIARIRSQNAVYDEQLKSLRKKAAKASSPDEHQSLIDECAYLASKILPEPSAPALMIGDVTPEYISKAIADNQGRIAQVDAEGGTFFKVIGGRYEKNGKGDFEVYLKGHAGDTIRVNRLSRAGELIHNPALTLLLVGQPSLLHRIGNVEELIGRGLVGRMLITFPLTMVGSRNYADRPIDQDARNRYQRFVTDALLAQVPESERVLKIEGDALEVWREVHDETEAAMRDGGRLFHIRSWAQKYAGHVARLAALLHLMAERTGEKIDSDHVMAAAAIGEYLQAHALAAFQIIGRRHDVITGRVLAWIKRHRRDQFTLADTYRDLRRGEDVNASSDLLPALEELERRGYIRLIPLNPLKSRGRQPSPVYQVNPAVLAEVENE